MSNTNHKEDKPAAQSAEHEQEAEVSAGEEVGVLHGAN